MNDVSGHTVNLLSRRLPGFMSWATRRHVDRLRTSTGTKGNTLAGSPVFVLDVVGRRSDQSRPVVLMEVRDGDDFVVAGSDAGHTETPNWYRNLMAAGEAHVEVGSERWAVKARQVDDEQELERYWDLLVQGYDQFATYRRLAGRSIPVAVLTRAGES